MRPEAEAWVAAAEVDYELTIRSAVPPEIEEGVCFHAQQCIEKYLKALLEDAGRPIPRTHDLGTLAEMVANLIPDLAPFEPDLKTIGPFAVAVRYPGADGLWDDRGDLKDEAELAARTMVAVRALIREHAGLADPPHLEH